MTVLSAVLPRYHQADRPPATLAYTDADGAYGPGEVAPGRLNETMARGGQGGPTTVPRA
ncbi:MAG TPA: hypothetical protein VFD04_09795 [Actinomycetes bacterium]|jgi:hypothetical protein|nr:hypothetical protein [Actinomycetes bacterium]